MLCDLCWRAPEPRREDIRLAQVVAGRLLQVGTSPAAVRLAAGVLGGGGSLA